MFIIVDDHTCPDWSTTRPPTPSQEFEEIHHYHYIHCQRHSPSEPEEATRTPFIVSALMDWMSRGMEFGIVWFIGFFARESYSSVMYSDFCRMFRDSCCLLFKLEDVRTHHDDSRPAEVRPGHSPFICPTSDTGCGHYYDPTKCSATSVNAIEVDRKLFHNEYDEDEEMLCEPTPDSPPSSQVQPMDCDDDDDDDPMDCEPTPDSPPSSQVEPMDCDDDDGDDPMDCEPTPDSPPSSQVEPMDCDDDDGDDPMDWQPTPDSPPSSQVQPMDCDDDDGDDPMECEPTPDSPPSSQVQPMDCDDDHDDDDPMECEPTPSSPPSSQVQPMECDLINVNDDAGTERMDWEPTVLHHHGLGKGKVKVKADMGNGFSSCFKGVLLALHSSSQSSQFEPSPRGTSAVRSGRGEGDGSIGEKKLPGLQQDIPTFTFGDWGFIYSVDDTH
ncbi:hypothetical protein G9A89_000312 [Geosiphon pyriformis]|nr:hypothetical protein G9A89_000312 [Geosiphon pyriformis]